MDPNDRRTSSADESTAESCTRLRRSGWRAVLGYALTFIGVVALLGALVGMAAHVASVVTLPFPVWQMAGIAVFASALFVFGGVALASSAPRRPHQPMDPATRAYYTAFLVGTATSVDTSWRFFGERLHITEPLERALMFSGVEILLIGAALSMRSHMRRKGTPGNARFLAWLLCGFSAVAALQLNGLALGLARVAFGPVLAVFALHYALGIEMRTQGVSRRELKGLAGQLANEARQWFASLFGLGDDRRDAVARRQDRAARRAARLALADAHWWNARDWRLARALRQSNVAHDASMNARMLAELAMLKGMAELAMLTPPAPWANASHQLAPARVASDRHQVRQLESPATATRSASSAPAPVASGRQHQSPAVDSRQAPVASDAPTEVIPAVARLATQDPTTIARAREMVAAGAGRPAIMAALGVTDHQAKQLIRAVRLAPAASASSPANASAM